MGNKKTFWICTAIGCFGIWLYMGHHKKAEKQTAGYSMRLTLRAAQPQIATVKRYLTCVGQCTPYQRVIIIPNISGTLIDVKRPHGGWVKKDEVLFQIKERKFKAALAQSIAQCESDQAKLELNVLKLNRSEELRSEKYLSQQEYDTYKANVAASKAQVAIDQSAIELKKIDLEDCVISAPFDGELSRSYVDAQNFVAQGTQLAILNQMKPIYADTFVSEKYVSPLLSANRDEIQVEARLIDDASVVQMGKLVFLANEVDKSTGTFDLRIEFENANFEFWAGRGVDLKIYYQTLPDSCLVPEGAVHEGSNGSFVYVINQKGCAEMCPVTVGQTYSNWIVVEGVDKDMQVIADSHPLLAPGMPVQIASSITPPQSFK